jgi:hypothetical protein
MRTRTRRRWSWPVLGALAVVVGAPALAHAQQSGLFPLAPIKRERVPCASEDPIYRLYRQEYFGYHPTCWRKFPAGWGCPSPEAPNAAEAFKLLPRDKPPTDLEPNGEEPGTGPAPGGAVPGGRPTNPAAPGGPGGAATPNPSTLPPLPRNERSPFELDNPSTTPPATTPSPVSPKPSPDRVLPSPSGSSSPPATAPGGNALPGLPGGEPTTPPATAPRADAATSASANDQPLLALPDPTVGPSSAASSNAPPISNAPAQGSGSDAAAATPDQAPRRTSLLSRMFSGLGLMRR